MIESMGLFLFLSFPLPLRQLCFSARAQKFDKVPWVYRSADQPLLDKLLNEGLNDPIFGLFEGRFQLILGSVVAHLIHWIDQILGEDVDVLPVVGIPLVGDFHSFNQSLAKQGRFLRQSCLEGLDGAINFGFIRVHKSDFAGLGLL